MKVITIMHCFGCDFQLLNKKQDLGEAILKMVILSYYPHLKKKNNVTVYVIYRNFNILKSSLPLNSISLFPSRSLSFTEVFLGTKGGRKGGGWEAVCYTLYSNKCSFTEFVVNIESDGTHCNVFVYVCMLYFAHIPLITHSLLSSLLPLTSPHSGFISYL